VPAGVDRAAADRRRDDARRANAGASGDGLGQCLRIGDAVRGEAYLDFTNQGRSPRAATLRRLVLGGPPTVPLRGGCRSRGRGRRLPRGSRRRGRAHREGASAAARALPRPRPLRRRTRSATGTLPRGPLRRPTGAGLLLPRRRPPSRLPLACRAALFLPSPGC